MASYVGTPGCGSKTNFAQGLWVAQSVGQFLAAAPNLQIHLHRTNIKQSLSAVVDHFSEGNLSSFAKQIQFPALPLRNWLSGKSLPGLGVLGKLCYFAGISILEFLKGEVDAEVCRIAETNISLHTKAFGSPQRFRRDRKELEMALLEEPPPSLTEVLRRLGYKSYSSLYYFHKNYCQRIKSRHLCFLSKKKLERKLVEVTDPAKALNIIKIALEEDPPPSAREVARRLGYGTIHPLRRQYPKQYESLLARKGEFERAYLEGIHCKLKESLSEDPPPSLQELSFRLNGKSMKKFATLWPSLIRHIAERYVNYRKNHWVLAEGMLKAALDETPPPSLLTVAKRLGITYVTSLKEKFPDLCVELNARISKYEETNYHNAKNLLKAALDEIPPPSIMEISQRLNIAVSTIYTKYSEEAFALTAHRNKYQKKVTAERKRKFQSEVKRIVIKICSMGQYPSPKRVASLLKPHKRYDYKDVRAALKSVKLELELS
ncbi:MAG TPA: hypothetical protein VD835_03040 [Pyrinomonadaceae bacterium]|nr:hypothetical protein [Pyrinomonadaceae bacterium]